MQEKQSKDLSQIRSLEEGLTQLQIKHWQTFSGFDTWQLWFIIVMMIVSLVVLFILIDKKNILLLGFFGLNYHVWFHYTNAIGIRMGLWEYPYQMIPFLPSFALDAALVPVSYILLYQWTLKHDKNIYLYSLLLSGFFAFIFKPILVSLDFFHMYKGINYLHLFLFYMIFLIVSKLITNLFVWLQQKQYENKT
ncbi:CBO0543 family protein [Paenisporosarcina sp. TG-14]|uniref:CBO0543 family protein n=1 Tax=Paenisporosarcina sp. TG-14 TaxID=1231057 RepID=UPI00031C8F9E|nr:CBO0543 family protein [Paenisporosarcina sp. TG-14]